MRIADDFVCLVMWKQRGAPMPQLLESGKRKQQLQVLADATYPLRRLLGLTTLTFYFGLTLLTAPRTFIVIRFGIIVPRFPGSRVIYVIAGLLAIAQICGWIFLFY